MKLFAWIKNKYQNYRRQRVAGVTIRYMFPAVLGTLVLLGASTISGVEESFVYLNADTKTVEVGQLVTVDLMVSAHTPINAVDITITHDQEFLEVFSVDRGKSVLTLWTEDPIILADSVQLVGGTFKRGFIGEHQIVSVKYRAKKAGSYDVSISGVTFVAGDGTGTEVLAAASPGNSLALFNFDDNTPPEQIAAAASRSLTTDLNGDGRVTLQDISVFMAAWSDKTQKFDFNNDGRMTFKDFSIILADFYLK